MSNVILISSSQTTMADYSVEQHVQIIKLFYKMDLQFEQRIWDRYSASGNVTSKFHNLSRITICILKKIKIGQKCGRDRYGCFSGLRRGVAKVLLVYRKNWQDQQ